MSEQTEGLLSRLGDPPAGGPAWLDGLRERARTHLAEEGFPGKRRERWRFTSVKDVVETPFARPDAPSSARAWVDERLADDGAWRVVETDGRVELDGAPPEGVSVRRIADVLAEEPAALESALGAAVAGEEFAALNAALFEDGLLVDVAPGAQLARPVHLVHVACPAEAPRAAYPRLLVRMGTGSEATLLESFLTRPGGDARHLTNAVAEVLVGANAGLTHVRLTEGTDDAVQLAYLGVRLQRDARFDSRVVALGGGLCRLELTLTFDGPGAEARLDGAYHVDNSEHVDHQLTVIHRAPRCTSRVRYRGLLDGQGHAVFNAIGVVERDAAGSSAHQENKNLLLSDEATVDTKPQLEIDCDDVTASHGSTVGALDAQQLFYLRSRGVPEARARDILTYAFVSAVLDGIQPEAIAQRARTAILARLPHGDAIREALG